MSGGTDGLAFVIQNASTGINSVGASACGIGYHGITNSLAVEFDTWLNSSGDWGAGGVADPNSNHVSVQTRGVDPNSADHRYSLGAASPAFNLDNNVAHTAMVQYVVGCPASVRRRHVHAVVSVEVDLAAQARTHQRYQGLDRFHGRHRRKPQSVSGHSQLAVFPPGESGSPLMAAEGAKFPTRQRRSTSCDTVGPGRGDPPLALGRRGECPVAVRRGANRRPAGDTLGMASGQTIWLDRMPRAGAGSWIARPAMTWSSCVGQSGRAEPHGPAYRGHARVGARVGLRSR